MFTPAPGQKNFAFYSYAVRPALRITAFMAALVLFIPALCLANDGPGIRARGSVSARADLDNNAGSYRMESVGAEATWGPAYLEYDLNTYHWNDYSKIGFSRGHKPWEQLHFAQAGLRLNETIEGALGWFWDGGVTMGWEEQASKSFGVAGKGGLTYQLSDELSGKAGVWVMAHPARWRMLPTASLDWSDHANPGFSATLGFPETMLRYRFDESLALRAGGKADLLGEKTYRLADESHVERKGYITSKGITAGVYVDASPIEHLTATVGIEYDMDRRYQVRSSNGTSQHTIDVDNTPTLQLNLGFKF